LYAAKDGGRNRVMSYRTVGTGASATGRAFMVVAGH